MNIAVNHLLVLRSTAIDDMRLRVSRSGVWSPPDSRWYRAPVYAERGSAGRLLSTARRRRAMAISCVARNANRRSRHVNVVSVHVSRVALHRRCSGVDRRPDEASVASPGCFAHQGSVRCRRQAARCSGPRPAAAHGSGR